jgi:hypothetical protein
MNVCPFRIYPAERDDPTTNVFACADHQCGISIATPEHRGAGLLVSGTGAKVELRGPSAIQRDLLLQEHSRSLHIAYAEGVSADREVPWTLGEAVVLLVRRAEVIPAGIENLCVETESQPNETRNIMLHEPFSKSSRHPVKGCWGGRDEPSTPKPIGLPPLSIGHPSSFHSTDARKVSRPSGANPFAWMRTARK